MPSPKSFEALIEVKACGICGSDIPRIYSTGAYSYPLIPGHEFSGRVVSLGLGTDEQWLGRRVGVFPLIPCNECGPCHRRQYEMCRNYSYLGSRRNGGFAEYVTVPENNLIELPDDVSYEAGAMLEPMAVGVHAIRRAGISHADRAAVCGLGTIGMLQVMFLLEAGVEHLYVIGNKKCQKEYISLLGLPETAYCDSSCVDPFEWLKQQTGGAGVDVFFECVGKNETLSLAVTSTAPGGTVMLIGNPASDMELKSSIYGKILRNQLTVKGNWNSSFTHEKEDDWHYVLKRISGGNLHPESMITQRCSFGDLQDGLDIMRDKTVDYLKVMICAD